MFCEELFCEGLPPFPESWVLGMGGEEERGGGGIITGGLTCRIDLQWSTTTEIPGLIRRFHISASTKLTEYKHVCLSVCIKFVIDLHLTYSNHSILHSLTFRESSCLHDGMLVKII